MACIAGQLFDLDRDAPARAVIDALRRRLRAEPEPDAFACAEMADLLQDRDDPAEALRWCEEGLERYYPWPGWMRRPPTNWPSGCGPRGWTCAAGWGLEPDALDRAVEAQLDQISGELRELVAV